MKQVWRTAVLCFLIPLLVTLVLGITYALSGGLVRSLSGDPSALDLLVWSALALAVITPPIAGYRLLGTLSESLSQVSGAVQRVANGDGDHVTTLDNSSDDSLAGLKQEIDAKASHLQQRLADLRKEKSRLEATLRTMAEGVMLLDSRKKILVMNPAAEALFGVRMHEAVGRYHLEITRHFILDEQVEMVLRTGSEVTLALQGSGPDGQVLEARLAPSGEQPPCVLLVLRDVTRFRKLEQMRTDFVANVTHELRTPLTSIRGFAETLLDGALENPEIAHNFIGIIKKESEHLGRLIEDILDLSQIEAGKWKMVKEPVQPASLIGEAVGRLSNRAATLGLTLSSDTPENLPSVVGDPVRLVQALLNLIDNGLRYTPQGGSVTVTADDTGPAVRINVADTGVGIPPGDLQRIFERFYRVDKARTRSTGGTGLGLSIVKHIVDAHGGTVSVSSKVGRGTSFTLTLPKAVYE